MYDAIPCTLLANLLVADHQQPLHCVTAYMQFYLCPYLRIRLEESEAAPERRGAAAADEQTLRWSLPVGPDEFEQGDPAARLCF